MKRNNIDKKTLLRILSYQKETGNFRWKIHASSRASNGAVAGRVCARWGYRIIKFEGKNYRAHRLVWFLEKGEWPKGQIDHIDGNKLNNVISNLRDATVSQNQANRGLPANNTSGYKGVSRTRNGSWTAKVRHMDRYTRLGTFRCPKEAAKAYDKAAMEIFGDFAWTNFPKEALDELEK